MKSNQFSSSREVATEFDKWAETGRGERMAKGHLFATQQLLQDLDINNKSVVLDAGCGIGWILNDLIGSRIAQGIGIDISSEMITIASSKSTLEHISFLKADTGNTNFENDMFSHIVCVESIYYNPQPLETLKEWLRISTPTGKLGLVIDLYEDNPASKYWMEALSLTVHNLSAKEWQNLLISAGWKNVSYRRVSLPTQITPSDFKASAYFPNYNIYQDYCKVGSLLVTGEK